MIKRKEDENDLRTSLTRWLSMLVLGIGIYLLFKPLIALFSFVKIFGSIISIIAFLVSLVLAIVIGWTIMALAWIAHRPILLLGMVAITAGVISFFAFAGKGKAATPAFLELGMG